MGRGRLGWKPLRHWLEYGACRFLLLVVPLLPRRMLGVLAHWVSWVGPWLVFWEAGKGRANLDLVYGEALTRREKARVLRQSFENIALTALYFFWSKNITADNVRQFVEFPEASWAVAQELKRQGKGTLVLLAHYGNWELMGVASGFLDIPRLNVIARPLKNPLLDKWVNQYRSRSGNQVIPTRDAIVNSLRALRRGELVALVFDQNVDPMNGGTFAPFLGLPAATTKAAATLSLRTGAPIVFATCEPLPGARYRLRLDPPLAYDPVGDSEQDIQRLTELCNRHLEGIIRQRPGPWLWMYKRWRIRPTIEQGRYPKYSKPARELRRKSAATP